MTNIPEKRRKAQIVLEYASKYNLNWFIETGTYTGFMVSAVRDHFDYVYSIELSHKLAREAIRRFRRCSNVVIMHGDSSQVLPSLLDKIESPCLFWLDAHYSKGVTARGDKDTPVMEEIKAISNHNMLHCVLIDDARLFDGESDYPSREQVVDVFQDKYTISESEDIFRIEPKGL